MVKKIYKNTFITSLLAMAITIVFFLCVSYSYFEDRIIENLKAESALVASGISCIGEEYFEEIQSEESNRITWIASDGSVLYDSKINKEEMDNHIDREEIAEALDDGEAEVVRYSDTLSQRTIYYAQLLEDGTIIRISYGYNTLVSLLNSLLQPLLFVSCILCIAMYVVANYTAKAIVAPINNIDLEKGSINDVKEYTELKPLLARIRRQNIQIDTKVRQLKREHENRDNFRREFTANVSHELKTPLTSVSGISEMMMNGIISPEDVPEFAANINKEAGRLINLVNDIILISELEAGDAYLQKAPVNMSDVVISVVNRLRVNAEKKNISMDIEYIDENGNRHGHTEHMPQIMVNGVYEMLEEMLINLCDNAIKYNKTDGRVSVAIKENDEKVIIRVEDTGIGIPAEDKTKVFQRFYRVDKSRSKEVGGTGLGLSIVKHVALFHGGSVKAEDVPGGGTCMEIVISK